MSFNSGDCVSLVVHMTRSRKWRCRHNERGVTEPLGTTSPMAVTTLSVPIYTRIGEVDIYID